MRDFKKLNTIAEEGYSPSQKTLETAHKLPNLSDADKVAIQTLWNKKLFYQSSHCID